MGKYYNKQRRLVTSAEIRDVDDKHSMRTLPTRVTLHDAVPLDNWQPVIVLLSGVERKVEGWRDSFCEVIKFLLKALPLQVEQFCSMMGVPWLQKREVDITGFVSIGDGWAADLSVSDSVLIARLKMLMTGLGLNSRDIVFAFLGKDSSTLPVCKVGVAIDSAPPPKLDSAQRRFVISKARNSRLLAPAGAGKTLTVLHRCKELVSRNPKEKILLVTFTRVARDELKLRLQTRPEFEGLSDNVHVTTLNQHGYKLLKKRFPSCRLISEKKDKKFVLGNYLRVVAKKSKPIYDNIESKSWIYRNSAKILDLMDSIKSLGMDHREIVSFVAFEKWHKRIIASELKDLYFAQLGRLSAMKLLPDRSPEEVTAKVLYDVFVRFHCAASELMMTMNVFTIEDQKYWGWLCLKDAPRISGAARYTQIMVDEFQDINPVDKNYIAALAAQNNADLTLVGDDDQTIFEWRGATPAYILDPDTCFHGVNEGGKFQTFVLEKNYRSPKNIVDISQRLISNNKIRVSKHVSAVQKGEAVVRVVEDGGYDSIAQLVIDDSVDEGISSIAVISRKKSQLIPYQIIFASKQVDFYAAEDLNVFLTDAFRALRSLILMKTRQATLFVATTDIVDDVVLLINHIKRYPLNKSDTSLLRSNLLSGCFQKYEDVVEALRSVPGVGKFKDFCDASDILKMFFESSTVEEMLDCVSECFDGFRQDFQKADDDIFYADPPFAELARFSRRYGSNFGTFYSDVELAVATLASVVRVADDSEDVSEQSRKAFKTKLHLMTALRTKGKEFDSVYVLQANDGIWPINRATTPVRIEAERRLFYVAVTRAKKKLSFIRGSGSPSPYLREMGVLSDIEKASGARGNGNEDPVIGYLRWLHAAERKDPALKKIAIEAKATVVRSENRRKRREKELKRGADYCGVRVTRDELARICKKDVRSVSRLLNKGISAEEIAAGAYCLMPFGYTDWLIDIDGRKHTLSHWMRYGNFTELDLRESVVGPYTKATILSAMEKIGVLDRIKERIRREYLSTTTYYNGKMWDNAVLARKCNISLPYYKMLLRRGVPIEQVVAGTYRTVSKASFSWPIELFKRKQSLSAWMEELKISEDELNSAINERVSKLSLARALQRIIRARSSS